MHVHVQVLHHAQRLANTTKFILFAVVPSFPAMKHRHTLLQLEGHRRG